MMNETDSDREAYQRLLQEYNTLEQHCEELKKSVRRNVSEIRSICTGDEQMLNAERPEDHGRASVRSTTSNNSHTREKLENIDWKQDATSESQTPSSNASTNDTKQENDTTDTKVDVALILKLQYKLTEVERKKGRIQKRLDDLAHNNVI